MRILVLLVACQGADAPGEGSVPSLDSLRSSLVELVDRHLNRAQESDRRMYVERLFRVLAPVREHPDRWRDAYSYAENAIRVAQTALEFDERRLRGFWRTGATQTRVIDDSFFREAHEIAVRTIEQIVPRGVAQPPFDPQTRASLESQIRHLVDSWRDNVRMLLEGDRAEEVAAILAAGKHEELHSMIGQPMLGLWVPLSDEALGTLQQHIRAEVLASKDRVRVDDARIVELLRGPAREEFSEQESEILGRINDIQTRYGNLLHLIWNESHPETVALLQAKRDLLKRAAAHVDAILQIERPLDGEPVGEPPASSDPLVPGPTEEGTPAQVAPSRPGGCDAPPPAPAQSPHPLFLTSVSVAAVLLALVLLLRFRRTH